MWTLNYGYVREHLKSLELNAFLFRGGKMLKHGECKWQV